MQPAIAFADAFKVLVNVGPECVFVGFVGRGFDHLGESENQRFGNLAQGHCLYLHLAIDQREDSLVKDSASFIAVVFPAGQSMPKAYQCAPRWQATQKPPCNARWRVAATGTLARRSAALVPRSPSGATRPSLVAFLQGGQPKVVRPQVLGAVGVALCRSHQRYEIEIAELHWSPLSQIRISTMAASVAKFG